MIHVPEGDGNPYHTVVWGREPLCPDTDTPVRVGVRTDGRITGGVVEWEAGGRDGIVPLEEVEGGWSATIGPFPAVGRYRFRSVEGTTTDWFQVEVVSWTSHRFTGVRVGDDRVVASWGGGVLAFGFEDGSIDWKIEPGPAPGGENKASLGGWEAGLSNGRLHLRKHAHLELTGIDLATDGEGTPASVRICWRLDEGEHLYGTGERYDSFDQRGRTQDVRVYEQYKKQGARTYFPLPWVISDRGYGLRVKSDARVRFDLGSTHPDLAAVTIPSGEAGGTFYLGTPKEVVSAYIGEVGRATPLPIWAYGPWMSSNEWDRDTKVREIVERTQAEGIPATVLVVEAWSDETTFYLFNDTEYRPRPGDQPVPVAAMRHGGRWPDPKGLVDWLHEQGIRVILWQIPVLKDGTGHPQHDADMAHAEASGYCVRTSDGAAYRNRGWWFPGARIIDFTKPEARDWWFRKRSYLLDELGVDGFKTDGGEHLWGCDVITSNGETGDVAANRYPTHYLRSYHHFLSDHGDERPVTFSRAGFTGSQAYPAHWAGDEDSTWAAYRASLTAGLSAAVSGVAFWSWDLAGFSGPLPSAELYMRAAAMAAFCPIMQYHSEHNQHRFPPIDRTPWNVAEQTGETRVIDVYRFYARLRMNLVPYLHGLGIEASRTGVPVMRPLLFETPRDPEAAGVDDQFLLGPDLLIAPILEEGAESRHLYVPEGEWWDLWNRTPIEPGWQRVEAPIDRIPVLVRGGAPIPLWLDRHLVLGDPVDLPGEGRGRLVLMVYPGTNIRLLHHPVTEHRFQVSVTGEQGRLRIESPHQPEPLTVWVPTRGSNSHELSPPSGALTIE